VLLDRQSEDDAEVLVLRGPVAEADVSFLQHAVADALEANSRGVVVDLSDTDDFSRGALDALIAAAEGTGWPRPPVAVCGAPASVRPQLEQQVSLHDDRHCALAHLDERPRGGLRREVVVDHGPAGPRQARQAVQQWAAEMSLGPLADDVLLIVSELVTNAVRHGSPPVRVAVTADDRIVTVGVVDGAQERPVLRTAPDHAESGRGMLLLSLLSAQHGVRPEPPGKVVWASLPR
jgi:anti-sigma regulatory factor (Ser/Thr protein kinase)/anti-anti-sigma regulatory factor